MPTQVATIIESIQNQSQQDIQNIKNTTQNILTTLNEKYSTVISFSDNLSIATIIFLAVFASIFPIIDLITCLQALNCYGNFCKTKRIASFGIFKKISPILRFSNVNSNELKKDSLNENKTESIFKCEMKSVKGPNSGNKSKRRKSFGTFKKINPILRFPRRFSNMNVNEMIQDSLNEKKTNFERKKSRSMDLSRF